MTDAELPAVALVLTKVAVPDALAAGAAINRLPIDSVPTPIGCVAVCRSAAPGDPEMVAQVISSLVQNSPVVLVVQREGQMTATRWEGGEEGEVLSPALMLDGAPAEVEELLLGQVAAEDLPGVVSSVDMSRWQAMRTLAGVARATRRQARVAAKARTQSGDQTSEE